MTENQKQIAWCAMTFIPTFCGDGWTKFLQKCIEGGCYVFHFERSYRHSTGKFSYRFSSQLWPTTLFFEAPKDIEMEDFEVSVEKLMDLAVLHEL